MSDKILEFNGSETLPHFLKANIQMEMPCELAVKILDLIQKNMPSEADSAESQSGTGSS